ncbi:dihydrofolate reductase family protein [Leifsonia shinshuensis]|uniref:Dihydrofolate reductase family protein n=1 Tax=Leifsonia shinshuensis TaxID=150026 RepID=A0A7G6YAK1_9MICO|nr:dihydrofolate reductase family protein [Leifsonia shinshuensis]QNE35516.1 dihydrofolate reductase family protein [Leifsonia shinshuensis]
MRTVVAIENISLDGYADSREGLGFEWTARAYDDEVDRFSNEHVRADVDTAVYGRTTYLGMQGFWGPMLTDPHASPTERSHAVWVDAVTKVVFSRTLPAADWNNSTLVRDDLPSAVADLKRRDGGTIAIYASPTLVHSFLEAGLIDELRLLIHPLTLGGGTPLIPPTTRLTLDLAESRAFPSGAVYTRYRVS